MMKYKVEESNVLELKHYGMDGGKEFEPIPSLVLEDVDTSLPHYLTTACCGIGHRLSRIIPVMIAANRRKKGVHHAWNDVPYNALFNDTIYSKQGIRERGNGIEIFPNAVPKGWEWCFVKNRVKKRIPRTVLDLYPYEILFHMPEAQAMAVALRDAASPSVLSFLNSIRQKSADQDIKLCLHVRMGNNEKGDWELKTWRHIEDMESLMKNTVNAMKSVVENTNATKISVFTASDTNIDLPVPKEWKIIKPSKTIGKPTEGVWFGDQRSETNKNLTQNVKNEAMAEAVSDILALGECDGLFIPTYSSFTYLSILLARARNRSIYFYHQRKERYYELNSIIHTINKEYKC